MMMKLSLNARPTQPDPDAAVAFATCHGNGNLNLDLGAGRPATATYLACWSAVACTLVMKSNLGHIRLIVHILFVDSIQNPNSAWGRTKAFPSNNCVQN